MFNSSPLPPRLLTVQEVASITGLSISTLNKRRVFGGGPKFVRQGKAVRYDPADIFDYFARNKFENTSQYDAKNDTPARGVAS